MANYLYNGVEFPPLPETTHQYMYIWKSAATSFPEMLVITSKPYYSYSGYSGDYSIGCQDGDVSYKYYDNETDWLTRAEYTSDKLMCDPGSVLWANFDVVDENGNVVLPASYPIDAETGEEITTYGLYKNYKTYLYNGVALPPLPESENTYVFVMKEEVVFGISRHQAVFTPETYFGHSSTGNWYIGSRAGGYSHSCIIDNVGSGAYDPSVWSSGVDYENDIFIDSINDVLWANFDVVDENGNVVLPASYPIDAETGEEITIYGLYKNSKTYLYNGVEYPPIPDTRHPYMYIWKGNSSQFPGTLAIASEPYYASPGENGWRYIGYQAGDVTYEYNETTVNWGSYTESTSNHLICTVDLVLWANFDVIDENGNVVLPASYPTDPVTGEDITIYGLYGIREAPPIPPIPTAITLGFQTGTAIRLMRGLIHN